MSAFLPSAPSQGSQVSLPASSGMVGPASLPNPAASLNMQPAGATSQDVAAQSPTQSPQQPPATLPAGGADQQQQTSLPAGMPAQDNRSQVPAPEQPQPAAPPPGFQPGLDPTPAMGNGLLYGSGLGPVVGQIPQLNLGKQAMNSRKILGCGCQKTKKAEVKKEKSAEAGVPDRASVFDGIPGRTSIFDGGGPADVAGAGLAGAAVMPAAGTGLGALLGGRKGAIRGLLAGLGADAGAMGGGALGESTLSQLMGAGVGGLGGYYAGKYLAPDDEEKEKAAEVRNVMTGPMKRTAVGESGLSAAIEDWSQQGSLAMENLGRKAKPPKRPIYKIKEGELNGFARGFMDRCLALGCKPAQVVKMASEALRNFPELENELKHLTDEGFVRNIPVLPYN